jgi:hypothetical protein
MPMEKKIIEVTRMDTDYKCILCCKNMSTTRINIKRLAYKDYIANFFVCDECLAKMRKEIGICE